MSYGLHKSVRLRTSIPNPFGGVDGGQSEGSFFKTSQALKKTQKGWPHKLHRIGETKKKLGSLPKPTLKMLYTIIRNAESVVRSFDVRLKLLFSRIVNWYIRCKWLTSAVRLHTTLKMGPY